MNSSVVTVFLLTVGVYLLAAGAPTSDITAGTGADHGRGHGHPSLVLPRLQGPRGLKYLRSRLLMPVGVDSQNVGEDFIVDDDDALELNKRQSEDYGHMRFGKRDDQFDDYGHMRFGRSLDH